MIASAATSSSFGDGCRMSPSDAPTAATAKLSLVPASRVPPAKWCPPLEISSPPDLVELRSSTKSGSDEISSPRTRSDPNRDAFGAPKASRFGSDRVRSGPRACRTEAPRLQAVRVHLSVRACAPPLFFGTCEVATRHSASAGSA